MTLFSNLKNEDRFLEILEKIAEGWTKIAEAVEKEEEERKNETG